MGASIYIAELENFGVSHYNNFKRRKSLLGNGNLPLRNGPDAEDIQGDHCQFSIIY
jgi:hypothetical protein